MQVPLLHWPCKFFPYFFFFFLICNFFKLKLVYCLSYTGYIPFTSIFVFGMTAGLSWPLPTEPQQVYLQRREAGRHPDREHRVSLYQSVGAFLGQ